MRNPAGLLSQKPLFEKYLKGQQNHLSAYHFSSVFLWQDFFDFDFQVIEESLCIFAHQKGSCFLYLPPLSKQISPSVLQTCFDQMNLVNPRTARVENLQEAQLGAVPKQYKIYPKLQEYVYLKDDLVKLKGHAYKSQRHDIHLFQTHYPAVFRPLDTADIHWCLDLYDGWAKNRHDKHEDPIYRSMLQENKLVHELALKYHKELGLQGYVVEVDQKLAAYSLGYSLNNETFCVLLEITDLNMVGLPAFIFNRVCSDQELNKWRWINTMDDFGLPLVAASKQAYHPKQKPVSYTLTKIQSL